MMNYQILHITYIAKGGFMSYPSVDILLNAMSIDWIQYVPGHWLINTTQTASQISELLTRLIGTAQISTLVVLRVNPADRQGLASPELWAWLKKYDNQPTAILNSLVKL